jgi:hypothetical protein
MDLDEVHIPPLSLKGWIPKAVPLVRVQGAKLLGGFQSLPRAEAGGGALIRV